MVNSLSIGTKNFAKLYEQVPMAERIGRSGGNLFGSSGFFVNLAFPILFPFSNLTLMGTASILDSNERGSAKEN